MLFVCPVMILAGLISSICIANDRSVIIPVERTRIVLYMYSNTLIRLNVYENVSRVDIYIYIYIIVSGSSSKIGIIPRIFNVRGVRKEVCVVEIRNHLLG